MASRALKHRKNVRKKDTKTALIAVLSVIFGICLTGYIGFYALGETWLSDLPDYTNLDEFNSKSESTVYASDGETVLAEFQLENRTPVTLDAVSDYVKRGTVAMEDERFYTHNGFDLFGTGRALFSNLTGGSFQGGSTITMQLARNTIISDEMQDISIKRKIREIYLSLKMEELYSKDEILQLYLNTINYGSGAYGIEAASERYFSKHANELTIAEAATLICIPQSPTYNNPIDYPERNVERRNIVLEKMLSAGIISADEAHAAEAEELVLNPSEPEMSGIKAYPYFTSYVRNQLMSDSGRYKYSTADLFSGGLKIVTTLDVSAQDAMETAAANKENATGFSVAGVAIEPNTGFIKAIDGGDNYEASQVNMATGEGSSGRQVGSTFKVFTLVAAIESGIDPATNIDCGYSVTVNGSQVYNYARMNYGVRSIASALAISSNTGFIRLALHETPTRVAEVAHRLGIKGELPEVPTLTLGVASLTPLQMSSAFATIANGGTYYEPECIQKITDNEGKVIVDNSNPKGTRAISAEVACSAAEAMKGVLTSAGTSPHAALNWAQPAAGKSGTTDDAKDHWFCGITPQISAAFWMGDPTANYTEARSIPDGIDCASCFSDFCGRYLDKSDIQDFPITSLPNFTKNFSDITNHIGGSYGYSTSYYYNTVYYKNGLWGNKNSSSNTYTYTYSYSQNGSSSSNSSSGNSSSSGQSGSANSGTNSGSTNSGSSSSSTNSGSTNSGSSSSPGSTSSGRINN